VAEGRRLFRCRKPGRCRVQGQNGGAKRNWQTIADYIKNTDWKAVGDTAGKAISAGIDAVKTYADGIKKNFAAWVAAGNAKQLGIDIGNAIANAVKDVVNLGKWIADSLRNKGGGDLIKGAIQTGIEWLAIGSAAVADFIVGFANGLAPLAKSIANAAMEGIATALSLASGAPLIGGALGDLAETIRSHKFEINWEAPKAGESTFYTPPGYTASSGGYGGGGYAPTPEGVTKKPAKLGKLYILQGQPGHIVMQSAAKYMNCWKAGKRPQSINIGTQQKKPPQRWPY